MTEQLSAGVHTAGPEEVRRIALALAKAHGRLHGNKYALNAYRAGVGATIEYWDTLARAALTKARSNHEG